MAKGFKAPVDYDFWSLSARGWRYLFYGYHATLKNWMARFPGRVHVFLLEEAIEAPDRLADSLSAATGLALEPGRVYPRSNEADWFFLEQRGDSVVRRSRWDDRDLGISGARAEHALAFQDTLKPALSKRDCEALFEKHFAADTRRCEALLGRSLDVFRRQKDLFAPARGSAD